MSRDGAGNFSRSVASYSAGQTISSTNVNAEMNDIASALTASLAKDGQTTPTANLPMGGFKHTGVAVASGAARSEYVSGAVAQDGGVHWCGTAGGTANALTLTPTPAIAAYAAGQVFRFIAGSNSTNTVTVAVSGLSAKAVQKGAAALASGDIDSGKTYEIVYDGTAFQLSEYSLGVVPAAGSGIGVSGATVSLDIAGLSEDTAPDRAADFVPTYDASGTANKKVAAYRLGGGLHAVIADQKAQNTAGGTFTAGAWRTRDLQTEISDPDAIVSIATNQFTLGAGTYIIRASVPAYQVAEHQARLYNITDTSVAALGLVSRSGGASQTTTTSDILAVVAIAGSKAFEVQHYCTNTGSTNGFGIQGNITTEQYTTVMISKIA